MSISKRDNLIHKASERCDRFLVLFFSNTSAIAILPLTSLATMYIQSKKLVLGERKKEEKVHQEPR